MPWTLIAKIGVGLIGFFVKKKEKKVEMNNRFIAFVAQYDIQVADTMQLGDDYESAMNEIKQEEEASKQQTKKP